MINPKILNSKCTRFIFYCNIGLIKINFPQQNFDKESLKVDITRRWQEYDGIKIHGIVDEQLIYFGKKNIAEIQIMLHRSKFKQCLVYESGETVDYDEPKARYFESLFDLDILGEVIKDCPENCKGKPYCHKDKIPPVFNTELYKEFGYLGTDNIFNQYEFERFTLGKAIPRKLGLSINHLQQFKTKKELREWLTGNSLR
jgi:hypothetical protein